MTYDELYKEYLELQKQLQYYKEYDLLTGVYSKNTFYEKVNQLLDEGKPEDYMLVCVDVERFKVINDIYGTSQGNILLQYLAENLHTRIFSEPNVFARLSADIFAACVPVSMPPEWLEENILLVFKEAPLDLEVVPAVGIYRIKERKLTVETMCDRAILALNTIKGDYQKHCIVYDDELWKHLMQEQEIISQADHALASREFKVYMQPKCNMKTGKIVGAEALVRWEHATKGIISPAAFIPVFEKNGFIKKLDIYIWEEVTHWICDWIKSGNTPVPISVNVSRMDIIGMDLFAVLKNILDKYQVPAQLLELEITETAYSTHLDEIIITVEKLMYSGYTVLMDDFGSGYSSLNMLKDINIDILKLDMKFLDSTNRKSRDILESIVHMAKWLNLRIIAEGVETEGQVEFLLNIGCEYAQGFYYYKPMPLNEFQELMQKEDKIEFMDREKNPGNSENLIKFKDLFHADMMSEQLLNNILGAIALYQYDGHTLKIFRGNSSYYSLLYNNEIPADNNDRDVMELIFEGDRERFYQALKEAKEKGDQGTDINFRRYREDKSFIWLEVRLFYLAEINGKSIYYAGMSDESEHMQAIETLRRLQSDCKKPE